MLTATTRYGILRGEREHGYSVFRGVPYAASPVGARRFAPAAPPEPWDGVRPALSYGAPALQLYTDNHITTPRPLKISREDCLFANIRTPAPLVSDDAGEHPDTSAKLPVFVFIHGGAFETGGGNLPLYSGDAFANNGIVFVNINYRLGVFGCMTLKSLAEESSAAGGYSITDVRQALSWIHENIEAFGGDPENVTIGGESAGSVLVSLMMQTDAAGRDFQRAIMESGSARGFSVKTKCGAGSADLMLNQCRDYLSSFGLTDDAAGLAALRKLPAEELISRWYFNEDGSYRNPVSDPLSAGAVFGKDVLPDPLKQPSGKVDLLFGYNTDEGTMFAGEDVSAEKYAKRIFEALPEHAAEVLLRYPVDDETAQAVLGDLIGLMVFKAPEFAYADAMSRAGASVYGYQFDYLTNRLAEEGLGVRHIAELNFVFDRFLGLVGADDVQGEKTASYMNRAWCGFIKCGDPNSETGTDPDAVRWEAYDPEERRLLRIDHSPHMEKADRNDELLYFNRLLDEEYGNEA